MMVWDGSLLVWRRRGLFIGMGDKSDYHETHAVIVCCALEANKHFKIRTIGGAYEEKSYQAAIIAPDVRHTKNCLDAGFIALLFLMPETVEAQEIRDKYLNDRVVEVPQSVMDNLLPHLREEYHLNNYRAIRNLHCTPAGAICEKIISALGVSPSTNLHEGLSHLTKCMIEVIEEKIEQGVKASELTVEEIARACLGREVKPGDKPGEIFARQTYATLRHYEVGVRLRECLKKLSAEGKQGARLDDIARRCGFWGGAALTTAFYKWFGISISEVSRHSHLESCQE